MLIQILGTGCPKCKQLAENAAQALRMTGLDGRIEKVTNLNDISAFGILSTPGLAVNGTVESAGKILTPEQIKDILLTAANSDSTGTTTTAAITQDKCACNCMADKREDKFDCGCGSSEKNAKKGTAGKTFVLVLVAVVVLGLLVFKTKKETTKNSQEFQQYAVNTEGKRLPRMLEFGSTTCVPCKMMEPVLKALQTKYDGKLSAEFYNVELKADIARSFNVSIIPTQVFLDPEGKELFRHNGYFPEEDIVKKWAELGYQF